MNRRDALKSLLVLSGSSVVYGADRFLAADTSAGGGSAAAAQFTPSVIALLDEIAEVIIPETADSGGAKAAQLGLFMQEIVSDYYDADQRATLLSTPKQINAAADAKYRRPFMALDAKERHDLLMDFETGETPEYYRMIKQLTTWGYFSSEVGSTQALAYDPVPGAYHGDLPLQPGQKAWA